MRQKKKKLQNKKPKNPESAEIIDLYKRDVEKRRN